MSISVVVVSCRRHPWLLPSLQSVLDQADEVVLVDNGSPNSWASDVAAGVGARVVSLSRNMGFPAGVNEGLKTARGDVVALLNDDAMASEGWLKEASETLGDPTIAAVSPKLLLAWPHAEIFFGDPPWLAPGDPRPLGRELRSATVAGEDVLAALVGLGVHELEEGQQEGRHARWRWTVGGDKAVYVPLPPGTTKDEILINEEPVKVRRVVDLINNAGSYLSVEGHVGDYGYETPDAPLFNESADRFAGCGGAMVMRADTLARLGTFASSFFAYYEDSDWCWRAQLAGLRVRYEPRATVRHVRGVSTGGEFAARARFLAARNRFQSLARNAPLGLLGRQLRRALESDQPDGLMRALMLRVPRGLAERRLLSRRWVLSPAAVFDRWAGVGETWPPPTSDPPSCHEE